MTPAADKKRVRPFPLAELPRVARAQAEASRLLMARLPLEPGAEWEDASRALGGDVTLSLVEIYAMPTRELISAARGAVVKLTLPGGRWALVVVDMQLAPRLARQALGVEEPELGAPRPLTIAEEGALEFLVAALVGAHAQVAGVIGEAGVAALLPAREHDGWLAVAQARLESPVGGGGARLIVPDTLRLAAEPARPVGASTARAAALSDAQVALRIEVGRTAVARADLAGLAAGDVVLFERFGVRDARGGPVTLRLGRGGFAARLDGDALTVTDGFRLNPGVTTMDSGEKSDAASADQLLRELPVEVVCELGRVTMSGRELVELRPGAVIPAGRPLAGPVDLTVGGRVVARGELVDVEGEIGVRIVQLVE